jgi:hypothetical protein
VPHPRIGSALNTGLRAVAAIGKGGSVLLFRRGLVAAVLVLCAATAGCSDLVEPGEGLARNHLV